MKSVCLVWSFLAVLGAAQFAEPMTNSSHNPTLPPLKPVETTPVIYCRNHSFPHEVFHVWPLNAAGWHELTNQNDPNGTLLGHPKFNTAQTRLASIKSADFAVSSCDKSKYKGKIDISQVLLNAFRAKVQAIILYTFKDDYCNITNLDNWPVSPNSIPIFTIYGKQDVHQFVKRVSAHEGTRIQDAISTYSQWQNWAANPESVSLLGGEGSTAVAMIILYSITGVITALFLIIIVTGAVRAHRHPERYGPRNALGRPRQSRAKGIARAMLDTIPIVKFGGREAEENKDVESTELSSHDSSTQFYPAQSSLNAPEHETQDRGQASAGASEAQQATAPAANTSTTPQPNSDSETNFGTDEALGCSICTDDFQVGQDIRVLPCNHKFHPACVDPWLLEVSGTCPLCRVDLQPQGQQGSDPQATDELPPPLGEIDPNTGAPAMRRRGTLRTFMTSRLNRQNASTEERIQILRRWREAHAHTSPIAAMALPHRASLSPGGDADVAPEVEHDEQQRRNSRLSSFSRLIRRRTDR